MRGKKLTRVLLLALVAALVVGAVVVVRNVVFGPKTIIAYFTSASAVYTGDQVRVSGVKVGTIERIEPQATDVKLTLAVDRKVPIPADAKAVLVAQNLISARYVQLTPAYETSGPIMADGAVIPVERTAIPVEWDEVKRQLMRLATDLGPSSNVSTTSVGRFIESAANAMDGNGDKLRQTIAQLSGVGRILAEGSGNIVDIIKNLQTFITTLRDSNVQIVQFQDRLASLSSVIDGSRSDLDGALKNLSEAVGEVQRFIAKTRDPAAEQIQRLGDITQNLADNRIALENVLHVAPTAVSNAYNIYNPETGSALGAFALGNFSNPMQAMCSAIGAVENATAPETAKLCAQYLGPALRLLNFNYLPFPMNLYLAKSVSPEHLVYTTPNLAPGGSGGAAPPPLSAPSVSAYTGAGDVAPPPGWGVPPAPGQGAYVPNGLPADPSPALYRGAPIPPGVDHAAAEPALAPAASSLQDLLLPAEAGPAPQPPATPEGTPPS